MDAILQRRSIRQYTGEAIPEPVITDLLKAAMSAPSAGNEQPWQYVVIDDRAILDTIPQYHRYAQMLKEAPLAILVCGDERQFKYEGYWIQDCAAATENILIAAQALGLGAVWLGVYPGEERVSAIRQLLDIPAPVIPFSLISLGYPAEEKPPADRYNPERVHRNRW